MWYLVEPLRNSCPTKQVGKRTGGKSCKIPESFQQACEHEPWASGDSPGRALQTESWSCRIGPVSLGLQAVPEVLLLSGVQQT